MIEWLEAHGAGRGAVTYRLRDWLFRRQRYWGEPFPIVYDETGLPIALPDSMLPVELPETDDFSPKSFPPDDADSTPEPPLGRLTDWVEVELDLGDGPKKYRRETNTMPNWAGSCWYELRYLDPTNTERLRRPRGRALLDGPDRRPSAGRRRAVRRRRRARGAAPAVRAVLAQGAVRPGLPDARPSRSTGWSTRACCSCRRTRTRDGFYVEAAEVVERDGRFYFDDEPRSTQEFGKIGKIAEERRQPRTSSSPSTAPTRSGMFEMFSGPLEQSRPWDAKAIVGPYRLLQRVWRVVVDEQTGDVARVRRRRCPTS